MAFNHRTGLMLLPFLSCSFAAAGAFQHAHGGGSKSQAIPTPFPFLATYIKFPVARLGKASFIEMGAERNVIPKGFAEKVKKDQQVVLLSYGYRKGGIARVFETPVVSGINPVVFGDLINSSGFFANVKRGDWKIKAATLNGVYVMVGSQSPEVLELAMKDLHGR